MVEEVEKPSTSPALSTRDGCVELLFMEVN